MERYCAGSLVLAEYSISLSKNVENVTLPLVSHSLLQNNATFHQREKTTRGIPRVATFCKKDLTSLIQEIPGVAFNVRKMREIDARNSRSNIF